MSKWWEMMKIHQAKTKFKTEWKGSYPVKEILSDPFSFFRGTQREYSSKPLKHKIVKRILVLNPTEQTCNTVGFRQFIVAYNTYLHKMVILTKYNLVENLGP